MGLTIHYKLSLADDLASEVVRDLTERAARYAKKLGCLQVTDVAGTEPDDMFGRLFVELGGGEDCTYTDVGPERGWLFVVCPGEGCEPAPFGLCQYPCSVGQKKGLRRHSAPMGRKGGWQVQGFCKTQYASEHGWPNFLRCHRILVSMLDFWQKLGVAVEVNDEGEYWETRSEDKLRAKLNTYNGLVATVAGALKDASDEIGQSHSVESPIFARADFERLEAEGWREFGRQLSQLKGAKL